MPFKSNAGRRRHIPKQRHRVTNWAEYDASLRARGSLTVPEHLEKGRQPAIQIAPGAAGLGHRHLPPSRSASR